MLAHLVRAIGGEAESQNALALFYKLGEGVAKDYREAFNWSRKSAEQGNAIGQSNLGWAYHYGEGVLKDYQESLSWYRKSSEQGCWIAHAHLGDIYALGAGVPRDFVYSHMWYNISASSPDVKTLEPGKRRDDLEHLMTASQLAEAQRLARECIRNNYRGCEGGNVTSKAPETAMERSSYTYSVPSGTGFYVSQDGHVITNHHVIAGCEEVNIHSKGVVLSTIRVAHDQRNDLALMRTTESPEHFLALTKGNPYPLQKS